MKPSEFLRVAAEDVSSSVYDLPNANETYLPLIVQLMRQHHTEPESWLDPPKPLTSANLSEIFPCETYRDMVIDRDIFYLVGMCEFGNYMGCDMLEALAAAAIASMILGKKPEEIKRSLNITNEFNASQKREILERVQRR